MTVDRAALIEAAATALAEQVELPAGCIERAQAAVILDAILPLIADATEAERPTCARRLPWDDGYDAAICTAARLVRSLGGNTDGDR